MPQETMNDIQKTARDFWLDGITFENDFKPHSDQKTSEYMKSIGHEVAKTTIFKWRGKFNWDADKEFRIKQLTSEDTTVRNSLGDKIKDDAVRKTIVDLAWNRELLGRGYEILEIKCKLIMKKYNETGKLSNEDVKLAIQITQLVANREDRMLDRKVVASALGREDALKAIAAVAGNIAFDGEGDFDESMVRSGDIIDVKIEKDDEDDFDE